MWSCLVERQFSRDHRRLQRARPLSHRRRRGRFSQDHQGKRSPTVGESRAHRRALGPDRRVRHCQSRVDPVLVQDLVLVQDRRVARHCQSQLLPRRVAPLHLKDHPDRARPSFRRLLMQRVVIQPKGRPFLDRQLPHDHLNRQGLRRDPRQVLLRLNFRQLHQISV